MDRLYCILEQAQSVVNCDNTTFSPNELAANLSGFNMPTAKPIAHKANRGSAKKRSWKKPKDKPKRPLSAYNLFFQHERNEILASLPGDNAPINDGLTEEQRRRKHRKTHGKIGFADLARMIADKWKHCGDSAKAQFVARANVEKQRYKLELEAWKQTNGIEEKNSSKKKSPGKPKAVPQPKSFAQTDQAQPDTLMSMLQASSQQTQMMNPMPTNPLMPQLPSQSMNKRSSNASIHEYLMAQCRENLLRQTAMQASTQMPMSCLSQLNGMGMVPMNNVKSSPMEMCNDDDAIPDETFSKESFFEDLAEESDSSYDVFSEPEIEEEKSLEEDLHNFLNDFDSEILFTWTSRS